MSGTLSQSELVERHEHNERERKDALSSAVARTNAAANNLKGLLMMGLYVCGSLAFLSPPTFHNVAPLVFPRLQGIRVSPISRSSLYAEVIRRLHASLIFLAVDNFPLSR